MTRARVRGASLGPRARAAALALATAAVFSPVLRNGFVDYDDPANILHNPWLGRLDAAGLSWPFTATLGGHFQPLAWLSLSLDKALWGLDPLGFHLTALLIHAATAAVLFLFLRGLLGGDDEADLPALAAAALYAWHPLRVESVAWATERRDLLCAFFLVLAAEAYRRAVARNAREPRLDAVLVAFAGAMFSKVIAAVFPPLLVLLDLTLLRRPVGLKRALVEKTPLAVVAAAGIALTLRAQGLSGAASPPWVSAFGDRLLVFAWTPGWTLWKTALPTGLAPYLSPDFASRSGLLLPVAGLTAALWGALAWAAASRRAGPAALLAGFLTTLVPALGLFRTGTQLCADRFTLLPAVVLAVGAAFALRRGGRRWSFAGLGLAGLFAAAAAAQLPVWRDAVSFWSRAMTVDAGPVAMTSAVAALDAAGRAPEAAALRARVRAEHPDSSAALAYAAEDAAAKGDWRAAEPLVARAVAADPYAPALRIGHGVILYRLDRVPEALAEFVAATERGPENAAAWHLRAAALARLGCLGEAEDAVRRALALDGDRADSRDLLERLLRAREK